MTRASLRLIFLAPILAAITLGFAAFAIYADGTERRNRLADVDAELVRVERRLDAGPAGGPPAAPPGAPSAVTDGGDPVELLVEPDGSITSVGAAGNPFSPATIRSLLSTDGSRTVEVSNYRVRVSAADGRPMSVTALPLDGVNAATDDFRRALALGGGVILLLVAAVVWLLVRGLTRPIGRITAAATRIAGGDLDTPIDAPTRSRELAGLSEDLDRMLTRLRSTLDERELAALEATRSRDDMRRFLADMAHELRTPLTALKGYSDLYARGMLESVPDVDRAMGRIGSESDRLYRLVDDMLQLAREGTTVEVSAPVDLAAVVDGVVADLRAADPDHGISLRRAPGDLHVMGSAVRLHQAVLNLAANACRHSEPGGEAVTVELEPDGEAVVVRVVDHGPGFDPEDSERIFVPFYRADTSRTRRDRGGAGLGLALARQIVDQHHGRITVETTPGGGATFVVTLPPHNVDRAAPRPVASESPHARTD